MEEKKKKPFAGITETVYRLQKNSPVLSAVFALLVMLLFQNLAMWNIDSSLAEHGSRMASAWMNLLRNNAYTGIIALGMCFVIISGGIDLSVGSMLCMIGAALMYLLDENHSPLLAVGITGFPAYALATLAAIALGLVLGWLNGLLITKGRIPPFIVTLGTMKIFRSVTQQMTQRFNPVVPDGFKLLASQKIGGQIVLPILHWVAITAVMYFIFKRTVIGRQVVAIGSNEKAARFSGIPVDHIKRQIYALCGVMVAIAAVIYVARIGSMDFANAGNGYEMDAIAGVIVGGTAMSGGRGNLIGAFIGVLIISVMNNILNSIGVPTFLCDAVRGAIIIFAVFVQKKKQDA